MQAGRCYRDAACERAARLAPGDGPDMGTGLGTAVPRQPCSTSAVGATSVLATGGGRKDSVTLCPAGSGTCTYPVTSLNVAVAVMIIARGQPVSVEQGRPCCGRRRAVVTVALTST